MNEKEIEILDEEGYELDEGRALLAVIGDISGGVRERIFTILPGIHRSQIEPLSDF